MSNTNTKTNTNTNTNNKTKKTNTKTNTNNTPEALIKIKDLNFYYGNEAVEHRVLKDINLEFHKNKVSAIIGPSGSGKSSLLRAINRIYELYPDQRAHGKIFVNKHNIMDHKYPLISLRREIGMVFQKPTPFPMTIFNNVAFAVQQHFKLNKEQLHQIVESALKQAAVWDEVKDKLHEAGSHLSGGQQQRLCIARTIALSPQILLLDEPTSALDPLSTKKIEKLILKLKKDYTIIMVTHNLKQAQRISDETIFMRDGELVEHQETEKFFSKPKHALTKEYLQTE